MTCLVLLTLSLFVPCAALVDTTVALDYLGQNASLVRRASAARAVGGGHQRHRRHRASKSRVALGAVAQVHGVERQDQGFPEYARKPGYIHPLDEVAQTLEKRAVAALSANSVMGYLNALVAFPTRSYSNAAESHRVEDFLKHSFEEMGYVACFHNFKDEDAEGQTLTNVVAHIPGTTSKTITVGAHYDSRPFDGKAPGAEDNGSGVASLLAVAKAFADVKIAPETSVYFVAFAGEEPGLLGSKHFVEALQGGSLPMECRSKSSFLQLRRDVQASGAASMTHKAIVMDEIGWASPKCEKPTVNLESFDWSAEVMDHLLESSQTHNGDALRVVHNGKPFGSDHMSFLDNNFMAVLTINGDDEAYPNYHQSSDTIDNVNPSLIGMISKMNLGALIRMAGVQHT